MSFWQALRLLFSGLFHARRAGQARAKLRSLSTHRGALDAVMEAYRRGDYEAALQAAEGLRNNGKKTADYCFYRGTMQMQLGQTEEAESYLRDCVSLQKDPRLSGLAQSSLGQALLTCRRYDEAMQCFETSLRLYPNRGNTYGHIAETWLLRGNNPPEALRWAKLAVEADRNMKPLTKEVYEMNLSEDLATLAWAVASDSHDRNEVDQLVAEAVSLAGTNAPASVAQVRYHCGRAYAQLADGPASQREFAEAAAVDLHGYWGRMARAHA